MSSFNFTRQEAEVILGALRGRMDHQRAALGIVDGYTAAVADELQRMLALDAEAVAEEVSAEEAPAEEAPVEEAPAE